MLRFLVWMGLVGCSTTPVVQDTGGTEPVVETGLCPWVEVVPEQANCTLTVSGSGTGPDATVFDALGRTASERYRRDVQTHEYDDRGRLVAVTDGEGAEVRAWEWDGCNHYSQTVERGGDVVHEIDVNLRDDGEIERRSTRVYWLGTETDHSIYSTEWDGDRLLSSTTASYGNIHWLTGYTYGTDEFGEFESWVRLDGSGDFSASGGTWYDELGRVVRTSERLTATQAATVWQTTYDGTALDATSTSVMVESPRNDEGTIVTYFLPDGRIDRIERTFDSRTTTVDYTWDCPASEG